MNLQRPPGATMLQKGSKREMLQPAIGWQWYWIMARDYTFRVGPSPFIYASPQDAWISYNAGYLYDIPSWKSNNSVSWKPCLSHKHALFSLEVIALLKIWHT